MKTRTPLLIAAAFAALIALPGQASTQTAGTGLGLAFGQTAAAPLALAISPETEYPKRSGPAKKRKRIQSKRSKKPAARKINPKGFDASDDERTTRPKVKINPKGFDASDDERTLKRKAQRSGKTNPRGFDASDDE